MKKLFEKSDFNFASWNDTQRKQSLVIALLTIVFFIFSAFTFFNALYGFADVLGSIVSGSTDVALKDALRSIPLFLSCFMSIWALLLFHASFRKNNDERWHKSLKKDAYVLLGFVGVNLIYVIVGRIAGIYSSLVEGAPSAWYPLDTILYSLIFAAIGIFVILYLSKFEKDHPYLVPARGEFVTKARGLYCTFMSFFLLIALFGLSAGILSLFIYDFRHQYVFYGIATILVYLLSPVILGFWQFFYNELTKEKKKEKLLPLAICSLSVSVLFAVLYMVALGSNMDAPSNAGFGMFPVAFAASVNIATLIMVFAPVIFSVVALIKGLLARKK